MNNLKVSEIVWALYVHQTQYVASFRTVEDATRFIKKFYRNFDYHLEPRVIYSYSEK